MSAAANISHKACDSSIGPAISWLFRITRKYNFLVISRSRLYPCGAQAAFACVLRDLIQPEC